jgi:hypothetical protein
MATCSPALFLLTVKEILLVHFIITNFRVAHKMLCTMPAKKFWPSLSVNSKKIFVIRT